MIQCEKILRHIKKYGSITTWDSFIEYGITRLASRINDFKKQCYKFKTEFETSKNRYGEPVSYKRYFFEKKRKNGGENK